MLLSAASTVSVSRFGCPCRRTNANDEALKFTNAMLPHLRTGSGARSRGSLKRKSLRIVASSESTNLSADKDAQLSGRRDLDVKQENLLAKEDEICISSDAGRPGFDESFPGESREWGGKYEDFETGSYGRDYVPAQALSLGEKETGDEFRRRGFGMVGRNVGRSSAEETDDDDFGAGDGEAGGVAEEMDVRTLLSAMGLIMGTAVGPGILGLPAATLPAGIQVSTLMILGAWAYVTSSILLVAEISCAVMAERCESEVSFTGLVEYTLGPKGAVVVALVYASLNYALLVACVSGLGSILHGWVPMPAGFWSAASAAVVGGLVAFAPFKILDGMNRGLCVLMLIAITSLVAIGLSAGNEVEASFGFSPSSSFASILPAMPLMVLTLGFHVIAPVVCKVMKGRPQEARKAIILGSSVPLAMVLAWNGVVLSLAGPDRSSALDPIKLLLSLNRSAAPALQAFAFSALGTTLICYALSFPKQLADTAQIFSQGARQEVESKNMEDIDGEKNFAEILPLLWALCPPTLAAVLWPTAFTSALDFAGVYANCFLFGILPPVMAWIYRYHPNKEDSTSSRDNEPLVPGDKLLLMVLFGIAMFLAVYSRP